MMVMGYFRSSSTKSSSSWSSSPSSAAAVGKSKKKKAAAHDDEEDGLREALLADHPPPPAAAAAEGGGDVPKGYFAVYAGEESRRRFVVPTGYLREPAFRDLMERAADEFGFAQAGGLRVPCAEDDFEELLRRLHRKNGNVAGGIGGAAGKGKKKAVVGRY